MQTTAIQRGASSVARREGTEKKSRRSAPVVKKRGEDG
jgi:hypothetical protein